VFDVRYALRRRESGHRGATALGQARTCCHPVARAPQWPGGAGHL